MIYSTKLLTSTPVKQIEQYTLKTQEPFFQVGDLVKIIDLDEDPREWGKFVIVQIERQKCRLKTPDGIHQFWVTDTEICRT